MKAHSTRWRAALGRAVVASPHPLATMAGLQAMLRGGIAVDAAVAAGATLAVVYPHMILSKGGDAPLRATPRVARAKPAPGALRSRARGLSMRGDITGRGRDERASD